MLPVRLPFAIDTRRLRSFDGTEIAYQITEAPYPGAPWIVLVNGLGGSTRVWRGQIDYLRDRYRFVSWDYRGLHASGRPPHPGAYALDDHARDLEAILDAERIERAGFVGWSMGVQLLVDAFHRLRGRAHSLALLNGVWGRPLDTLVPLPRVRAALLPVLDRVLPETLRGRAAPRPLGQRAAASWLRRLGLEGSAADPGTVTELTDLWAGLDAGAFLRNLQAFGEPDGGAAVASIDVPALLIAGDCDPITPRELAQQAARRIPRAELLLVRGGRHCAPVEHPDLVSLRLERFYRDHGL